MIIHIHRVGKKPDLSDCKAFIVSTKPLISFSISKRSESGKTPITYLQHHGGRADSAREAGLILGCCRPPPAQKPLICSKLAGPLLPAPLLAWRGNSSLIWMGPDSGPYARPQRGHAVHTLSPGVRTISGYGLGAAAAGA